MCALDKTSTFREQLAGSLQITFPPEPRAPLEDAAKTYITFTKPDGTQTEVPFYPDVCGGTRIKDKNENWTIREVLEGTLPVTKVGDSYVYDALSTTRLTDTNDQVPSNRYIDWACLLDSRIEYLGADEMQVTQIILFWGDIVYAQCAGRWEPLAAIYPKRCHPFAFNRIHGIVCRPGLCHGLPAGGRRPGGEPQRIPAGIGRL